MSCDSWICDLTTMLWKKVYGSTSIHEVEPDSSSWFLYCLVFDYAHALFISCFYQTL